MISFGFGIEAKDLKTKSRLGPYFQFASLGFQGGWKFGDAFQEWNFGEFSMLQIANLIPWAYHKKKKVNASAQLNAKDDLKSSLVDVFGNVFFRIKVEGVIDPGGRPIGGEPTAAPSVYPSLVPTAAPSSAPSFVPSMAPTSQPTAPPVNLPTSQPTASPVKPPTEKGYVAYRTMAPTSQPTVPPVNPPRPTSQPTVPLVNPPTDQPSIAPPLVTAQPSAAPRPPTDQPSAAPPKYLGCKILRASTCVVFLCNVSMKSAAHTSLALFPFPPQALTIIQMIVPWSSSLEQAIAQVFALTAARPKATNLPASNTMSFVSAAIVTISMAQIPTPRAAPNAITVMEFVEDRLATAFTPPILIRRLAQLLLFPSSYLARRR